MKKLIKKEIFVFSILLIFIVSLFFWNILFNGKTLIPSHILPGAYPNGSYGYKGGSLSDYPVKDPGAFAWHHEPAMNLNHRSYASKEIPLWNPYNAAGEPQAADGQSASFFPLIVPLFIKPSSLLWDLFMLGRLFIAGLFTYLLARKLAISKKGSALASIAFTFSGYMISYITMMHLNVEMLIPAALFFTENLFQKTDTKNSIYLSFVLALSVLAGMPESTFLLFAFTFVYFLFRVFYKAYSEKNYPSLKKPAAFIFLSFVLGAALSAILIFPLLEYLKISWNSHPATKGLMSVPWSSAVNLVVPQFLGVMGNWNDTNRHLILAYVGVIPLILALSIKLKKSFLYFFAGFATLFLLKAYGFPIINWLGYLPFINVVTFPKYASPFFALSIAILAGFTLDNIKSISLKRIFSVYGVWLLLVLFFTGYYWKDMAAFHRRTYAFSKVIWAFAFVSILTYLIIAVKKGRTSEKFAQGMIILLIGVELFNYIPKERNLRHDSYLKPPYVSFLEKDKSVFRVTAIDKVLYPNTNIGFDLYDYRSLNALHIDRYMDLIKLFSDRRMLGHITGDENIDWNNQIIDLLNIKYVLTKGDIDNRLTKFMIDKTKPPIGEEFFVKDGVLEEVAVFSKSGTYQLKIRAPLTSKGLSFKAIAESEIKNNIKQAKIKVAWGDENKELILDTKNWQIFYFDLLPKENHIFKLTFNADLPKGTKISIKDMQFNLQPSKIDRFKLVYKKDINIYKNKGFMPRAFIAYDALNMGSKEKVYRVLRKDNVDLTKTVLLEKPLKEKIGPIPLTPGKTKISEFKNNSLAINAETKENGLLFLSDAYFPGWKAYIDGKPTEIYIADYLFRAVYLPKGKHTVIFKYQPFSFLLGSILSGLALVFTASFLIYKRVWP